MKSYTPGLGSHFDSHLSLVTHLDTCYIVTLGASTPGEAKTKSAAPGSLDRIHRFNRSPGTTLTAGHWLQGIWRDFPFSFSSGQLIRLLHFPWLLTVPWGGGGTREPPLARPLDNWHLTVPLGGGTDRRLVFLLWTEFFEHPEGGGVIEPTFSSGIVCRLF